MFLDVSNVNMVFYTQIIQIVGIGIPFIGLAVLLSKEQNRSSTYLMLSNISGMIMNATYLLMLQSGGAREAILALKIEFLGNLLFYFFFVLFVVTYLKIKYPKWLFTAWSVAGMGQLLFMWNEEARHLAYKDIEFSQGDSGRLNRIFIDHGQFAMISDGFVSVMLMLCIAYTVYKVIIANTRSERRNYCRLLLAQLIVIGTKICSMAVQWQYDIVPISCSIAVLVIITSVVGGDFYNINDMGKEWALEDMNETFAIVDASYRLQYVNKYGIENFGDLKNTKIGKRISKDAKALFMDDKTVVQFGDRYFNKRTTALINQKGEVTGYCLTMGEITDQHRMLEQIQYERDRAEEAVQARSDFMSNMSHEIRTPMNAIVGMTDIMLRSDMSDENRGYLMNIKNSGVALLSIINDILDFSKIDAGKMELVNDEYDPMSMFNDIRMIILNRIGDKPIDLVFDIDEELPAKLYGDSLRLRQVIINIANNAAKFTEVGQIKLSLKVNNLANNLLNMEFSISDTGQGIKDEDLDKLFKSFSQVDTKKNHSKEGTGLGLAISKQIVELMGGSIGVKSEYGKGSEFYFDIIQESRSSAKAGSIDEVYKVKEIKNPLDFTAPDAKILLVDDNEMNRKVAIGLLAPIKMQIDVAENGQFAVNKVERNEYDLILMDHMMPVMDGVEATTIIRGMEGEYYKNVPILALSANVIKEAQDEFRACGMNDVLAKPIELDEMCDKLKTFLPAEKVIMMNAEEIEKADNIESMAECDVMSDDTCTEEMKEALSNLKKHGLSVEDGIKYSGSRELFVSLLKDYYQLIDMKANKIEKCLADGMIKDYTIEVHALKSTSRMIGLADLSDKFKALEALGDANNVEQIMADTPAVLEEYKGMKELLAYFGKSDASNKKQVPNAEIIGILEEIKKAIDEFDMDGVDSGFASLDECLLPKSCQDSMDSLRAYIADFAMEDIVACCDEIAAKLQ